MRFILSVLIFLVLQQSALACAGGRLRSFDWGDKTYSPSRRDHPEAVFFIGKVAALQAEMVGETTKFLAFGTVNFEVLKDYKLGDQKRTEITAVFSGKRCGGSLTLGEIGYFAVEKKDGKYHLIGYIHGF